MCSRPVSRRAPESGLGLRLVKVNIHGFGRLADGSMDLSPRVIAVVGPNEAGKSTLLEALVYLSDRSSTLSTTRRSRTLDVSDDTTVVTGHYVLDEEEAQGFNDLQLEQLPQTVQLSRRAGDTTRYMRILPTPVQSREVSAELVTKFLDKYTADLIPSTAVNEEAAIDEAEAAQREQVRHLLSEVTEALKTAASTHSERESLLELGDKLETLRSQMAAFSLDPETRAYLDRLIDWQVSSDPTPEIRRRLGALIPIALLFSDADRTLPSTFTLDETSIDNIPAAVQNLADMANLDLPAVWTDLQQGNRAGYASKMRVANKVLKGKFEKAWRQSDLTVNLALSGSTMHIDVHQGEDIVTPIDERSAGLRMYVALAAFLERHSLDAQPILLIDEAETHLHIDAQADLVASFMRQREVSKVVYTTHSPACLPFDLGTNVRAVIPSRDNLEQSTLENSFWRNAAGFTPLMIAMGAGAAAFSTARYVVLAEGPTEMLLLPSLIRAATGIDELPYQVAPGLSESAPEDYAGLDIEGARVAFLVDGDKGGSTIAKGLKHAGISEDRIAHLGSLMLEHVLDPGVYAHEYGRLFQAWNPHLSVGEAPDLSLDDVRPWPKQLDEWARTHGEAHVPGKRDVASHLVEHGNAIPSVEGAKILVDLHAALLAALKLSN